MPQTHPLGDPRLAANAILGFLAATAAVAREYSGRVEWQRYLNETEPDPCAIDTKPIGVALLDRLHLPLGSLGNTPASVVVTRTVPEIPWYAPSPSFNVAGAVYENDTPQVLGSMRLGRRANSEFSSV